MLFVFFAGFLYSLPWFLYGSSEDPLFIIILQILHGLSFGVFFIASFDYITRLLPKALLSTGHLLFFSFMGIAGIVGSLFGGILFDVLGGQILYIILGWIALIGTIFMIVYHTLLYER